MTGDESIQSDSYSHDAGIIPRVLFKLFNAIELKGCDHSITCSFLELYNEELRDLLDDDDSKKIRIFDDSAKKSVTIQGLTDAHLGSPISGMKILQHALEKRHVAATKINDLSSRSHTIFTINVALDADRSGEYLTKGKINLVDLAGSENIGKSGAENKRAREAGMINQSLLTLGRVINGLVDKSPHIPYRESKLTRLLQDSLGGRTKTCIIATVSPALVNVEETLSTLEYANRAKSIKNKPQMNSTVPKKSLLKDYASDMEKLRQDLIATRKKNGIYLDSDNYKEMMAETESQKILVNDQQRKLDSVNKQLKAARELVESTKQQLLQVNRELESSSKGLNDNMLSELESTSLELQNTRNEIRNNSSTGLRLSIVGSNFDGLTMGQELISTLDRTITDVNVLHDRLQKKYKLDNQTKENISTSCYDIESSVSQMNEILGSFTGKHNDLSNTLTEIINQKVSEEVKRVGQASNIVEQKLVHFDEIKSQIKTSTGKSEQELKSLFNTVDTVKQGIQSEVRDGLKGLQNSAVDICGSIEKELSNFKSQIQTPIADLSNMIQLLGEEEARRTEKANKEITRMQESITAKSDELQMSYKQQVDAFNNSMRLQQKKANEEKQKLLQQMTQLVDSHVTTHENLILQTVNDNLKNPVEQLNKEMYTNTSEHSNDMKNLLDMNNENNENLQTRRRAISSELEKLMTNVNESTKNISTSSNEIQKVTKQSIDQQVDSLEYNINSLDDFVAKVNNKSHEYSSVVGDGINTLSNEYDTVLKGIADQLNQVTENFNMWSSGELSKHTNAISYAWNDARDESSSRLNKITESLRRLQSVDFTPSEEEQIKKSPSLSPNRTPNDITNTDTNTNIIDFPDDTINIRTPLNEINQAENQLPNNNNNNNKDRLSGDGNISEISKKRDREEATNAVAPRNVTRRRIH